MEEEKRSAIYQCERNLVFNAWEIGRHLFELSESGVNIKAFIESGNHSFSYPRAAAFKAFYRETKTFKNIASDIALQIGVDKTLELVQPLKSQTSDFLLEHPVEELKEMSKEKVREAVSDFQEKAGVVSKQQRAEMYFLDAEDKVRDVVGMFEGAFSEKYSGELGFWDGRVRLGELIDKMNRLWREL